jgi:hypothetical protein
MLRGIFGPRWEEEEEAEDNFITRNLMVLYSS